MILESGATAEADRSPRESPRGAGVPRPASTDTGRGAVIAAATGYARRGWSVIPLKQDKKPAVRSWASLGQFATAPNDVPDWFGRLPSAVGVGIVLGGVSGNLYVRDFDNASAYEKWRDAHPEVSQLLPTVRTSRGYHVYGRWPGVRTMQLSDGELRGERSYVVAPPSTHPSGAVYTWSTHLPDGEVPEVDPVAAGLTIAWLDTVGPARATERTETTETQRGRDPRDTERAEDTEDPEAIGNVFLLKNAASIESAISGTQPGQSGKRNLHVFKLARAIKAIPDLANIDIGRVKILKPIVREWHRRARPDILTKDFGTTWGDFVHAWSRVKHAEGDDVLGKAVAAANAAAPPEFTADYDPRHQLLAAICRELQRLAGSEPFFLSNEKAGDEIGVDKGVANRWIKALIADGALVVIRPPTKTQATRYRWIDQDDGGVRCQLATAMVHLGHGSTHKGNSGGGEGERRDAIRDRQRCGRGP